jgi:hypothetical protein
VNLIHLLFRQAEEMDQIHLPDPIENELKLMRQQMLTMEKQILALSKEKKDEDI